MNDQSSTIPINLIGAQASVMLRAMDKAARVGTAMVHISRVHSGDLEFRLIESPFVGVDLAEPGSDRSAVFIAARQCGKTDAVMTALQEKFGIIRDDGVRVEEAPEAPAPATDAPQTVTLEQIEGKIVREDYIQELNGGTLTICVLTLANGFDVVGTSGCADPAKFNAELGRKYAREDAIKQVWPLEGYLLRERMWQAGEFEQSARAADEGWGTDPRKNDYSRPMDAQDAPVTASAAVKPVDPADTEWRRLRALDMAIQAGSSSVSGMLIDHAKEIDAYLLGEAAGKHPRYPYQTPDGRWLGADHNSYADYQQAKAKSRGSAA
ncbi:Gp49 family protein [Paracoccus sp. 22332]|uniref:Gp49 family protein n=1 Tax=Paracoccus sp. 22332 TaxID=3453913 RepID=UPI003F82D808